jgi:prepilin-type N-terminal cleavage/methylation domain-containing protein
MKKLPAYNFTSRLGFTLIELLVVIFITVLIATISIANFRQGERSRQAALASDSVINTLRQAQAYALSGKSTTNADPTCRVPQYYYVAFTYSNTLGLFGKNVKCNTSDLMELISLPQNIRIKASGLTVDAVVAATNLSVAFYPPYSLVKASTDGGTTFASFTTVNVTVETADGQLNRTVKVDGVAGRIGE